MFSAYLSKRYLGSTAIGPFQNKIERKKNEIKSERKPNVVSVELKDTKTSIMEKAKINPLRKSSFDKDSNLTSSLLSPTYCAKINVDKSYTSVFS